MQHLFAFVMLILSNINAFRPTPRNYQDRVVISKVGINIPLHNQVSNIDYLQEGAVILKGSGNPIVGQNMVIVGHRLRAGAPLSQSFFPLPSVQVGDEITVHWHRADYHYLIDTVTILPSTHKVDVLTGEHMVTLVTCTPLISSTYRLVVTAKYNVNNKR